MLYVYLILLIAGIVMSAKSRREIKQICPKHVSKKLFSLYKH